MAPRDPTTTRTARHAVQFVTAGVRLRGDLALPAAATGLILFTHGSGSGRSSLRNADVARALESRGFATLLIDLLTPDEVVRQRRGGLLCFDIDELAMRVIDAIDWLRRDAATRALPLGIFGWSTGAAAAVLAACGRPHVVRAVVSLGGRPDLAGAALEVLRTPTLLIVGSANDAVVDWNQDALARMRCTKRMNVVPSPTHSFAEPDTREQVAILAADWFGSQVSTSSARSHSR